MKKWFHVLYNNSNKHKNLENNNQQNKNTIQFQHFAIDLAYEKTSQTIDKMANDLKWYQIYLFYKPKYA